MSGYRSDRPGGRDDDLEEREGARASGAPRAAALIVAALIVGGALALAIAQRLGEVFGDGNAEGLIGPSGFVAPATAVELRWHALDDADRYYVFLTSAAGDTVFAMNTQDTTVLVPTTVEMELGESYRWWAVAVMPDGTQRPQDPLEFTVGRP